jgi:hypothetical protein
MSGAASGSDVPEEVGGGVDIVVFVSTVMHYLDLEGGTRRAG